MIDDRWMSDSAYEAKPLILILTGAILLSVFDQQFAFSGLVLIIAGTLIAKIRLSYRLHQVELAEEHHKHPPTAMHSR